MPDGALCPCVWKSQVRKARFSEDFECLTSDGGGMTAVGLRNCPSVKEPAVGILVPIEPVLYYVYVLRRILI